MRKRVFISIIVLISVLSLYGRFDNLFEMKLKLLDKYPPQKNWIHLKVDNTFNVTSNRKGSEFHQGNSLCKDKEKLYVLDNMGSEILSYDFHGCFQKIEIPSGKKIGKILFPKEMIKFKDNFIIYNSNSIDIFDKDLKPLKRVKVFLTGRRIATDGNNYYIAGNMIYGNKSVLLVKLNKKGNVINHFELKKGLKEIRIGSLSLYRNLLVYTAIDRNYILFVDGNFEKKKTIKMNYALLNELEKDWYKGKDSENNSWSAMLITSTRIFKNRLFVFLNMPRLEILELDFSGKILKHYYNNSKFKFMRWMDFEINEEKDEIVFYVMGFSIKDDGILRKYEFGIFKLKTLRRK